MAGNRGLALALVAWTACFCIRLYERDGAVWLEACVLLMAQLWTLVSSAAVGADESDFRRVIAIHMISTACIAALWSLSRPGQPRKQAKGPTNARAPEMRPLIWPSRTTHTRLFPKKHSFNYSYLLVGVPVDWVGSSGSLLSSGATLRSSLFHVDAADHLDRDAVDSSLKQKLDAYLVRMSIDPAVYPHAYLVTAPRCLGFCFNPVSFWYLYTAERKLAAMILEVNNTFDERRMYLLKSSDAKGDQAFSNTWQKDFHVSPFNEREGSYVLKATDPRPFIGQDQSQGTGALQNNVTLLAADGRPKLVARVFAVSQPLSQWPAGLAARASFLLTWLWVGFVTIPRIVWEAGRLYFGHALGIWFRPEVAPGSIGRRATAGERVLETFFSRFLEQMTLSAAEPVKIIYERPSELGQEARVEYSNTQAAGAPTLRLRVLSPAFYSRFVHYAHTAEAFDREFLCTDERNRTIWMDRPALLGPLLSSSANEGARPSKDQAMHDGGWVDRARWALVTALRCPPAGQSYGEEISRGSESAGAKRDIRARRRAAVDVFAHGQRDGWRYRGAVLELFTAQRVFGGVTAGVGLVDAVVRIGVSLAGWRISSQWEVGVGLAVAAALGGHVLAACKQLL